MGILSLALPPSKEKSTKHVLIAIYIENIEKQEKALT
jgi:hypothetical protein